MSEVGTLEYAIKVITKEAEGQINNFNSKISIDGSKAFNKFSGAAGDALGFIGTQLKRTAIAAGALSAVLGTKAIKDAGAFQASLSNINTLLQVSQGEINGLGESIEKISLSTGIDNELLSGATYDIVSAGISDTADALKVLEKSKTLGVAGLGSTKESTDLMTSAINAFGFGAEDSEKVASILFNTVKDGKTTVAELAVGFGQVAPSAKAAGVTVEELQSATATLTTSGLKANLAQTRLRAAFDETTQSGTDLDKAFASVGLTSANATVNQLGFVGALEKLKEESGLTDLEIKNLFGSVEAGGAAYALLTTGNEKFKASLEGTK